MGGRVNILLGLTPFIVFFILMRLVSPLAGLAAAFAVAVLFGARQWWCGEQIKILQIGTLLLFGVLVLYTLAAAPHWSVATVRLVVDGGLFYWPRLTAVRRAVHVAIRPSAGATAILGFTAVFHHQPAHYWSLDGSVCDHDRGRRRRRICRGNPALDRYCGVHRGLCRRDMVHQMVPGLSAAPR